ncbi:MAG TPA: HEAT repeat domain-containing protein [Aggregatilineales bacterium]|nr:HEAT repeat domain-containing protein [Aggregatilineales bacterium]
MELKDLLEQLRDPDPWARVEALRILAMVEETRALKAIEWVFTNDPEVGVRKVAQWAGRILWTAAKNASRRTQTLTPAEQEQSRQALEQELFLNRLLIDQETASMTYAMEGHALEYELNRILKEAADKRSGDTKAPLNKPDGGRQSP